LSGDPGARKRVLRIGIAVAALVLGGSIGFYLSTSRLDRSGSAYTDNAVSQILNAWSDQELMKRASPQFREAVDQQELHAAFDVLSHRLGLMQACSPAQGRVRRDGSAGVTASYELACRFDRGAATVHITLLRGADEWQILGFSVDSPAQQRERTAPGGLQPYHPAAPATSSST
jgi:hypothetical protein